MPLRRERLYNFRGLKWAALGFIGLVLLAMGFTVWQLRSDAIEDTYKDNGNVATVLAEQIAQTIRSVDLVLDDIQDRILLLAITTPEELRHVMSSEYGHAILKSRADRFAQADVITALDSTGQLLATSRAWPAAALLAGRLLWRLIFLGSANMAGDISVRGWHCGESERRGAQNLCPYL